MLAVLLGLAVVVSAQETATRTNRPARRGPSALPAGTQALRNLEYVPNGHERQKLDLYLPEKGEKLPLIIWVHGGAWQEGSKDRCPALPFLNQGYAVASINYRLSQHALYPAQIEDCKAAVRWLRANAAKYRLDPDRFGAWGSSAGGHLVALLGTTGGVKDFDKGENTNVSSKVQAVCDWFGPTDFLRIGTFPSSINHDSPESPESKLLGGPARQIRDKAAQANPITFITSNAAPFLIMHGDQDNTVPINQSELLNEALKKAGIAVTYIVVPGAGHAIGGEDNLKLVRDFFEKHLKAKK